MADKDFKVKTGLDLPNPLPIIEGGTGQTTANNALNAMLPSQTTHASRILGTDGTNVSWVNPGAAYQTSAPSNPVTGQLWVDSDETGDSLDPYIIRRKTITATAGQTVFTTDVTFTDGYEQIYYNGVLLVRTADYTTSGGTNTVTLLQGASAGDTIELIAFTPINLINTATLGANTFTSAQQINSSQNGNNFIIQAPGGGTPNFVIRGDGEQTFRFHNTNTTGSTRTSWKMASRIDPDWSWIWYTDLAGNGTNDLVLANKTSNPFLYFSADSKLGIGTSSPSEKLSVIGNAVIAPTTTSSATTTYLDVRMTGTADGSPNAIRIGADASGGSFYGIGFIDTWRAGVAAATPLSLRTEGTEKVRLGTGNDHVNMGFMRTWNIGQPTNMIVSGGTNCIRILINKSASQNYYRGFMFDVFGGGGYDWPGNGLATYFAKFMITFTGTDTGRLHLIQEYGRSYLNNTGTEITYNTYSATTDSNYYYLTINFKGVNASSGYRPLFSVITYDAGNGGSTAITGSNNQVYNVLAI